VRPTMLPSPWLQRKCDRNTPYVDDNLAQLREKAGVEDGGERDAAAAGRLEGVEKAEEERRARCKWTCVL
jgi:hypothetical protein